MSGFTPKYSLAPPHAELRACFHFVEDQQRAVFVAEVAESLQESWLRNAEADVHQNRLEDDGRDLAGIFFEAPLDAMEIVEAGDDDVGDGGFRDTAATGNGVGRVGIAIFFGFGFHADERGVVQPVIRALELEDFVAIRGGARDAAGVHRHFGAARTEAHHLDRIALADFFGKLPFLIVGHAERRAFDEAFSSTALTTAGWQCPAISAPKQRL